MATKIKRREPVHPGAIFPEDSMKPRGTGFNRRGRDIVVPFGRACVARLNGHISSSIQPAHSKA